MSSLQSQLAKIQSLDANRLTSRGGYPSSKSYLFPPKEAASHDLHAIYSLGLSGFEEIVGLDPEFAQFDDELFSERAKRTDRMMLNKAENEALSRVLERCLRRLGNWVGLMAGGKCIEWLVRRFRVHEMNSEVLLQVFLPYHSSPNFARILAILSLPTESPYHAPFAPLISKAQAIPRTYISAIIAPEREKSLRLLKDVAGMIGVAIREGVVHRALLAFWTGTMVELLEQSKKGKGPSEGLVKVLVETFVEILSTEKGGKDVNAAVYPPLILLNKSTHLADEVFEAVVSTVITPNSGADVSQRLLTLLVLLNGRKAWTRGLGEEGSSRLALLPQLGQLLLGAIERYDFDGALATILAVMTERPDLHQSSLLLLIESELLSPASVSVIAATALRVGSENPTAGLKTACRSVVASLRERHPTIVDTAAMDIPNLDRDLIEKPKEETTMLNLLSADITARVEGINALLEPHLATGATDVSATEKANLRSSLLARLGDDEVQILNAIYQSPESRSVLLGVCSIDDILAAIRSAFASEKLNDKVIQAHLTFICNDVYAEDNTSEYKTFKQIFVPVILGVNGRSLSDSAWEVISSSVVGKKGAIIPRLVGSDRSSPVDIAGELADCIPGLDAFDEMVSFFISHLSSTHSTSRLLSHLVLIQLLALADDPASASLNGRILGQLRPLLTGPKMHDFADVAEPLSPKFVAAVTSKPNATRTWHHATISLLTAIAQSTASQTTSHDWLVSAEPSVSSSAKDLYTWSNSDLLPPVLSRNLLQSLFMQLGDDTLLFLASTWTSTIKSSFIKTAALKHAVAFVLAHRGAGIDFQLLIPALLLALQDSNKSVRTAGTALLEAIETVSKGSDNVYALDTVYGDRSGEVQLLKQSDLQAYLAFLHVAAEKIVLDAAQIRILHVQELSYHNNEVKKDAAHRRAVIGSLLSHVHAWKSFEPRLALLTILAGVDDRSVFRGILPLLTSASKADKVWLQAMPVKQQRMYLDLLWSSLRPESAGVLQEDDASGWQFIVSLLVPPTRNAISQAMRTASMDRMEQGVFKVLPQNSKAEYIVALLESLDEITTDGILAGKTVLANLPLDVSTIVSVFDILAAPLDSLTQRKKHKPDETNDADKGKETISHLTSFIESRTWSSIPGNARLLASLFAILSQLLTRRQTLKDGIDYLEQELLGASLALLEKISDPTEIQRAHVGIEVIIKVIRASTNPRTSQRALLVASELARLIPEAVLHNAMPIFTFMGASDLQRDDAYSYGVVEKTVERIVPVMAKSLRVKATNKIGLYKESKTFISIFTDMASRLPKHRTLPFFVHLVKCLGAEDYLAPISMLLVDRSTTKAGRSGSSVSQTVELPQGVAASFEADTKLNVVSEVILEVGRLVEDQAREDKQAFLSGDSDFDRTLRQITGLLSFATALAKSLVGKPCDQSLAEETVKTLLLLASAVSASVVRDSGVPPAVQSCLGTAMQLLSAQKFLAVILSLLNSQNEQDISVALNILVERLPRVRPEVRVKNASTISEILKRVSTLLGPTSKVNGSALSALHAIASTAQTSEDGALAGVLPNLISNVGKLKENADRVASLSLLQVATRHLASRVIPYIQGMVTTTLALIGDSASTTSVIQQSYTLQAALLEVVPSFIGSKQLIAIAKGALDGKIGSRDVLVAASKKVSTKTLFPVVMDLWKSVQSESPVILSGFFDLLRLVLKNADRAALPGLIKPIFAFFLDVFDLRHRLQLKGVDSEAIQSVEASAIGSFLELVTKLNEATFKPLFIRLYDWAVIDLSEGKRIDDGRLVERQTVLFHVMMGLLSKFKNLLSPYIGTLQPHIEELLQGYKAGEIADESLLALLLDVLAKSFDVDDNAYWTDALHLKMIPLLVALLDTPLTTSNTITFKLANALSCLAGSTSTENVLKSLNTSICLSTRSDIPSTRLAALQALEGIWSKQPEELASFVQETVGEFLSELVEDENSDVENMARRVLASVEASAGDVKEYLE